MKVLSREVDALNPSVLAVDGVATIPKSWWIDRSLLGRLAAAATCIDNSRGDGSRPSPDVALDNGADIT
jgi:hypothetical protein